MDKNEFSVKFDLLYNNITSSSSPGISEKEKGQILTKAQLEVLKNHLNAKGNKYGEGYDGSSKRQIEFSTLVKVSKHVVDGVQGQGCYHPKSWRMKPVEGDASITDMLSILNEQVTVKTTSSELSTPLVVVPVNHVEMDTLLSRPYKCPPRSQAWRLVNDGCAELTLHPGETPVTYTIRYVKIPKAFDLKSADFECELPEVLHEEVLQRAVEIAKAIFAGDPNHQQLIQAIGERSE